MIRRVLQSVLCVFLAPMLVAQETLEMAAPTPPGPQSPSPKVVAIPKDTEIELVALESISSKTATKGQPVRLVVAKNVTVNGLILIPKGTLATGEVSHVTRGVPAQKNGFVEVKPTKLILGHGARAKLRQYRSGDDACGDFGPCWALWVFLWPIGLIGMASNTIESRHDVKKGDDEQIEACSLLAGGGYTANRITIQIADLHSVKPAPEILACIDRGFPERNRVQQ